ncbi:MAG TPA: response regulator transcription factor [Solirubrobacter sp.]|nr:response regulator transcription factor [Solirubrobacter sp.]
MATYSVLVADDHPLTREGLVRALRDDGRFTVVAEAADGRDAVALAQELTPDLAVLDARMPQLDGIQAMQAITRTAPGTRVVMLSAFDDRIVVRAALASGASGYLTKDADRATICDALARVAAGEIVTPRPS